MPLLLGSVASAWLVQRSGAAWTDIAQYVAVVLVLVTFPGTVAWNRLWTGERGSPLERAVFGSLLGLVIQVPVYLAGVAIGQPRLTGAMPVCAALVWAWARRRRAEAPVRAHRRSDSRLPLSMAWALAVAVTYGVAWQTRIGFVGIAAWGPGPASPSGDQQFQLAIVSELRHHVPPTMPTVDGLGLQYHYFVNAHLAASTWWVDVEPWLMQDRLLLPVTMGLVIAATGMTALRWTGSGAAGALAIVVLTLVGDLSPFRWSVFRSAFDERFLAYFDPISPSLQYSIALLVLMLHVAIHVIRLDRVRPKDWFLLACVVAILPGAKGTAIAVALAGCLFVLATCVLFKIPGRARIGAVLALVAGVFVLSQLIMFRGAAASVSFAPLDIVHYVTWALGIGPDGRSDLPWSVAAFALFGLVLSWSCTGAGALGLLRGRGWRDPAALLPLGMGIGGIAASLTFGHPHLAQDYFARSSSAPLAVVSAYGVWWLLRGVASPARRALVYAALPVGGLLTVAASHSAPLAKPVFDAATASDTVLVLLRPYLVIAIGLVLLSVVLAVLVRRGHLPAAAASANVIGLVLGLGLARVPQTVRAGEPPSPRAEPGSASIGIGGLDAARWVRDQTDRADLVATNAHTFLPNQDDNRHFWIAAISERRVFLEGWGYTPIVTEIALREQTSTFGIPFWDQEMLARNDRAFQQPSPASIASLRRAGVRWLFVDVRYPSDPRGLARLSTLRYASGAYRVYEVAGA